MNKEYVRKDINTSDIVEGTEADMHNPVDKTIGEETRVSKSILDKAPTGESFPHEAPVAWDDGPFRWWL